MDTKSVWDFLSGISIGTIIAWIAVIGAIITFLCTGTVKLYKWFTKYKEMKDENERFKNTLQGNSEKIDEMCETINKIYDEFEAQKQINYKQVRHSIVRTCDEAIRTERISANKYKSLMEMYEEYITVFADLKPNGYVHKMIDRVSDPNQVTIIGQLDE